MSKNIKIQFVLSLILAAIFLSACSTIHNLLREANIRKPEVEFVDSKLTGLSFSSVDFMFNLKVDNPNPLGVKLDGFDYDFLINGASFIKGSQEKELEIKANDENTVQLPLSLGFMDLYDTFQSLRSKDKSTYQLKCAFSFNIPVLGVVKVPVSKKGEFPLLKRPKIKIDALRLQQLNITGAELKLGIRLNNPNAFSMILKHLQYNFEVNQQRWVAGDTERNIRITEKGESIIEIPFSLDFLQVGHSVYRVLTENRSFDYRFKANLDLTTSLPLLEQFELPFEHSGEIAVIK